MANVNPGPAQTSTPSSLNVLTPVNALGTTNPVQGSNALRLLASFRAAPVSGTGDVALGPIINATNWVPATTIITNGLVNGVSASVAAVNLGVFSAPAAGGTAIRAAGVLSGQTASNVATVAAANAGSLSINFSVLNLYLNVTTALAGATVDIFIYGYDLS